jgi:hypothetical protein
MAWANEFVHHDDGGFPRLPCTNWVTPPQFKPLHWGMETSPTISNAELSAELSRPWTSAEREVWRILERGLLGYSFRRHAVLKGILVSFYCPELGVVLQLLGDDSVPLSMPDPDALTGLGLKLVPLPVSSVSRVALVKALEEAVGRGRLWPED